MLKNFIMKKVLLLFLFFGTSIFSQSNENYIKTTQFNNALNAALDTLILSSPVSNINYIASQSIILKPGARAIANTTLKIIPNPIQNQEFISYFDGLGKTKQQISIGQSPDGKDIVQHIEYDQFGRMSKQYLPHEYSGGTLGSYRIDTGLTTKTYYQNNYPEDFSGITNTNLINAYSEKEFENSPLNRVLKQSSPGEIFKIGSGHELKFEYKLNVGNEVKKYSVNLDGSLGEGSSYYNAGQLIKNIAKNEDWKTIACIQTNIKSKIGCGTPIIIKYYAPLDENDPEQEI